LEDEMLVERKIARYGWRPDTPDARDHTFAAPPPVVAVLKPHVDLSTTKSMPAVLDQGQLGSCTANSLAAMLAFVSKKDGFSGAVSSRLFIYYNERVIEGTVKQDAGAELRDGMKSVATVGAPPETDWPYVITKFATKPPAKAYKDALKHEAIQYLRVSQDPTQLRGCLAAGYPFVFGFSVYSSFESPAVAKSGVVNMPAAGESMIGGHAVCAVGYDDPSQRFIVRNSWGPKWGMSGNFTIPYSYLMSAGLASDFWTVRQVSG
jgi:C1A family cysteine protease